MTIEDIGTFRRDVGIVTGEFAPKSASSQRSTSISRSQGSNASRTGTAYTRLGFKRALDVAIAVSVLLVILPLLPLIALALIIQDGAPIIFRQARMGLGSQRFQCLKFRSMAQDAELRLEELLRTCARSREEWETVQKLRRDPRIHPVGAILRKSSLDEIPQLWNVIRGDMSIVGPRPMLPEQVSLYGERYSNYTSVRPGITGLWQVSGRNALTFEERVALDEQYVENVTFWGDFKILVRTVWVVAVGHGSC